jgi:hypothetical protein
MLLAKHFGVASACLGQVEQERQKPGHRGRHRLNQIIYGVRSRRCWAFYDRIDVAMHCLTGFLDIVQPADKALPKLFVFFARQIFIPSVMDGKGNCGAGSAPIRACRASKRGTPRARDVKTCSAANCKGGFR